MSKSTEKPLIIDGCTIFLTVIAPWLLSLFVMTDKHKIFQSSKWKISSKQQNVWWLFKAYLNSPYFLRPVCVTRSTVLPNSRQFRSTKKIIFNLCMLAFLSLQTSGKRKVVHKFKKNKILNITPYRKQFDFWGLLSLFFGTPQLPRYRQPQVCHRTGQVINAIGHITRFCIFSARFSIFWMISLL